MVVTDRELKPGDIFTAEYEGTEYELETVSMDEGRLAFKFNKPRRKIRGNGMIDNSHFGSLSAAGGAVVAPKSCNGWKFWTRSGTKTAHAEVIKRSGVKRSRAA